MEPKRFYRNTTDRKIAGVAGGLAEYFMMDPMLVRLIFVVLAMVGGGGVLIYVILWIVTPEKPFELSQPVNQTSSDYQPKTEEPDFSAESQKAETPAAQACPPKRRGSLIGGLVLITLGALFLADEFFPAINFGDLWPVILIVIGIGLLINTVTGRKNN